MKQILESFAFLFSQYHACVLFFEEMNKEQETITLEQEKFAAYHPMYLSFCQ